jgi:hypothetical protein
VFLKRFLMIAIGHLNLAKMEKGKFHNVLVISEHMQDFIIAIQSTPKKNCQIVSNSIGKILPLVLGGTSSATISDPSLFHLPSPISHLPSPI